MATVLYITANPSGPETSYSMAVGKAFVEAYRDANPKDEIVHLDLYQMDIPQLDADVFSGWAQLAGGASFEQLTGAQRAKVGRIGQLADQFAAADKYVFVSPIWNYSYPPVLKAYIDSICIAGKTFKYVAGIGRVGLLSDKKALHIQASGSVLSPGSGAADMEMEMGHRHLRGIMDFLGVPSLEGIFVEGMAETPDRAQAIKEKAIRQAREVSGRF